MDHSQIAGDLNAEADRLEAEADRVATEYKDKAARLREAAAILAPLSNGAVQPAKPATGFTPGSINEKVAAAAKGRFMTIPELSKATGLDRRQVTRALHKNKARFIRRERESENGRPEYRLKTDKSEPLQSVGASQT